MELVNVSCHSHCYLTLMVLDLTNVLTATYLDFFDAGHVKWIEIASPEKFEKLKGLYEDDTFIKLMKKVAKYSA